MHFWIVLPIPDSAAATGCSSMGIYDACNKSCRVSRASARARAHTSLACARPRGGGGGGWGEGGGGQLQRGNLVQLCFFPGSVVLFLDSAVFFCCSVVLFSQFSCAFFFVLWFGSLCCFCASVLKFVLFFVLQF